VCPPSNFAAVLSTASLPSSFRSCYAHCQPPRAVTAIGTSPPIPDSAASPPTGCSSEHPPAPPCQAGSSSPPHARAGRPTTPSPLASSRFPCHRDRPARGDQRRVARCATRLSRWARPVSPGLGPKYDPTLCCRLNSFSN
jgi:hypothetical protein